MPKHYCSVCKETIHEMDFYMESVQGKICSSCLVDQKASRESYSQLFPKRGPKDDLCPEHVSRMAAVLQVVKAVM